MAQAQAVGSVGSQTQDDSSVAEQLVELVEAIGKLVVGVFVLVVAVPAAALDVSVETVKTQVKPVVKWVLSALLVGWLLMLFLPVVGVSVGFWQAFVVVLVPMLLARLASGYVRRALGHDHDT